MSILINGIDMPKACVNECPLAGWACLLWKELGKDATERRHENCPIVEIPPHGSLIDADALIENWWKEPQDWMDKDQVLFHITGIRAEISNAPTIIEAENFAAEEKSEQKLKPCPFCGGEAIMQQHRVMGDDRFIEFWIFCNYCLGQTRQYFSAKRAIEAWNRRTNE